MFFRGADGCVLVYDVNDAKSFDAIESWRDMFLNEGSPRDPESFPFVLLGNKVDMPESQRQVSGVVSSVIRRDLKVADEH